jgi:alanine racemase
MIHDSRYKSEKTWIELSRKNLRHNLEVFRGLCGAATPIWTVKANAYGHGAALVVKEIKKTIVIPAKAGDQKTAVDSRLRGNGNNSGNGEWLGVDSLDEAIVLRREGIDGPIIVLGWVPYPRLHEIAKYDLRLLLSSVQTVKELSKLKSKNKIRVHLKIDTGTTRQGIFPEQALVMAHMIRAVGLILEGAAMHFANIEDVNNPTYADLQIERFTHAVSLLKASGFALPIVHAACSAAVMTRPETIFTAARVGIGLYGLDPSPLVAARYKQQKRGAALKPVLSWYSRIALLKKVSAGTPVGYGLTERTKQTTMVAIVPVGYADGYDRSLSSHGYVLINGKKCRVMGRVCMNMIIIDATPARGTKENDQVTLIGFDGKKNVSANELAAAADTINYEIVARLAEHINRFVI